MKNQIGTLKNGKVATTSFVNAQTKQVVFANSNSFGHNVRVGIDKEFDKIAENLKRNISKSKPYFFTYSQRDVESLGFQLLKRGELPLW